MSLSFGIAQGADLDTDSDGVADTIDNCILAANPNQKDTDGDGYGNMCDGDLNNNGYTNAQDYVLFRNSIGTTNLVADISGNGYVNAQDVVLFKKLIGTKPGPSALRCEVVAAPTP